jgi:hypothetical protein
MEKVKPNGEGVRGRGGFPKVSFLCRRNGSFQVLEGLAIGSCSEGLWGAFGNPLGILWINLGAHWDPWGPFGIPMDPFGEVQGTL